MHLKLPIMKKYILLFVLLLSLGICTASAQSTPAVKWRSFVKMTSPTEGVLTIKAIIADGYHIYGTKANANSGPRPTSFDFKASTGIRFIGDFKPSVKAATVFDKAFNTKLEMWSGTVTFTRKFRVTDAKNAIMTGQISYMACNGASCMPPKKESVRLTVPPFKK